MSLHDDDNGRKPQSANARAGLGEDNARRPQVDAPVRPQEQRRSLMDLNSKLRRSVARSGAGEAVSRYVDGLKKILDDQVGSDNPFRVLVLDSQQRMTALSAIIVTLGIEHNGQRMVAAHTMLVESTNSRLPAQQLNINGQNVEIETVPGDTADNMMWKKVTEVVTESFGAGYEVIDAGFNVLPTELAADDLNHLHAMLYNATAAVQTTLDNVLGGMEEPFNVGWIGEQDRLTAKVDYNPQPLETAAGLPVRADISVLLHASRQQQGNSLHNSSLDLARVDGYVDLVYSPPPQAGFGQQQQTQHFYPRLVITNAEPVQNAITMELQLLALVSATLLTRNTAWAGVFRPRAGTASGNLRNIGALGLEIPQLVGSKDGKGKIIDTQGTDFGMEKLFQLVSTAIHPDLVYTVHVPEAGDQSWIQLALLAAAQGNQDANEAIIQAADNLTCGNFRRHFQGGPVVVDDSNRIHMGYFQDTDGVLRDIRTIDYLALLNFVGEKDMGIVVNWCNSFDQVERPIEQRLDERTKILRAVLGDSMRLTGYARQVTFTPDFIMALTNASAEAGLVISPERVLDYTGRTPRGNMGIGRYAVGGVNQNMFNVGSPWGGYRSGAGPMGRWGRY